MQSPRVREEDKDDDDVQKLAEESSKMAVAEKSAPSGPGPAPPTSVTPEPSASQPSQPQTEGPPASQPASQTPSQTATPSSSQAASQPASQGPSQTASEVKTDQVEAGKPEENTGPAVPINLVLRLRCVSTMFLCPRQSKNGGGALSVTPVHACIRASVRPLSKFGVRSITFERLHRFNSNLVC